MKYSLLAKKKVLNEFFIYSRVFYQFAKRTNLPQPSRLKHYFTNFVLIPIQLDSMNFYG